MMFRTSQRWTSDQPVTAGKTVWNRGFYPNPPRVRLNAEMVLAFPALPASEVTQLNIDCGPNQAGSYGCGLFSPGNTYNRTQPPTYALWQTYANMNTVSGSTTGNVGNTAFLKAFPASYNKMVNAGYNYGTVTGQKLGTLSLYTTGTCSPSSRPTASPTQI
jgi:hypothetical protein